MLLRASFFWRFDFFSLSLFPLFLPFPPTSTFLSWPPPSFPHPGVSPLLPLPPSSSHHPSSCPLHSSLSVPSTPLLTPAPPGWFPQLRRVRGRWPENWPLGERWAILLLLGSWLIIGVPGWGWWCAGWGGRGVEINQGGTMGNVRSAAFYTSAQMDEITLVSF